MATTEHGLSREELFDVPTIPDDIYQKMLLGQEPNPQDQRRMLRAQREACIAIRKKRQARLTQTEKIVLIGD